MKFRWRKSPASFSLCTRTPRSLVNVTDTPWVSIVLQDFKILPWVESWPRVPAMTKVTPNGKIPPGCTHSPIPGIVGIVRYLGIVGIARYLRYLQFTSIVGIVRYSSIIHEEFTTNNNISTPPGCDFHTSGVVTANFSITSSNRMFLKKPRAIDQSEVGGPETEFLGGVQIPY